MLHHPGNRTLPPKIIPALAIEMTDRQTDADMLEEFDKTKARTNWFVTAYHEDVETLSTPPFPNWVKKVVGGKEACPSTGTIHFQGLINTTSIRFSQIHKWLPKTKIFIPRDLQAVHRYCMKRETAVGEKSVRDNPAFTPYVSADQLALMMAQQVLEEYVSLDFLRAHPPGKVNSALYSLAMTRVLAINDRLFGSMMNPSFEKAWIRTLGYWISKARVLDQKDPPTVALEISPEGGAGSSITPALPLDF